MWRDAAKTFCLNTALHGYKFIFLPKRILLERVLWAIICAISLFMAISLLLIAWFDFRKHPTLLVTDSNHYPIWNYDFPAITVCNFNKISKRKAFQLARNLSNVKDKQTVESLARDFRLLLQLIIPAKTLAPKKNYTRLQNLLDEKGLSVEDILEMISPDCDEMLRKCLWKGEEKRCESIFEKTKTTDGLCCSFNYFASKNYSFKGILAKKAPKEPRRVSACGYQTGLEVTVNNEMDDYFANFAPSVGYTILVHYPYNFPDWNVQALLLGKSLVNLISIDPMVNYCSDDIKTMRVDIRQCLFPNERELLYFDRYTHHNCQTECRMNLTLKLCNCVPFFYTNGKVDPNQKRICNLYDVNCLKENNDLIISSVPGFNFSAIDARHIFGKEEGYCQCLPDCERTEYIAESSSGVLCKKFTLTSSDGYELKDPKHHSLFRAYFNDLVGIRNRMDVKFNWHTLLAYYGGLLGLFIGFSFVSGVEIFYFFTERFINLIKMKNGKKKLEEFQAKQLKSIQEFMGN